MEITLCPFALVVQYDMMNHDEVRSATTTVTLPSELLSLYAFVFLIVVNKAHVNNVQNDSRKGYLVVSNGKLLTQRFLLEIAEAVQEELLESEREFQ